MKKQKTYNYLGPVAFFSDDNKTGNWRYVRPVIKRSNCNRCGLCEMYCPVGVISVNEINNEIDLNFCKGCGICENVCSNNCVTMEHETE